MALSIYLNQYINENDLSSSEIRIFQSFIESLESIPKQLIKNNQLVVYDKMKEWKDLFKNEKMFGINLLNEIDDESIFIEYDDQFKYWDSLRVKIQCILLFYFRFKFKC
jgi:chaperonin GroEL (HSP60 family)